MTGFGFCAVNHKDFRLEISVRSLNSRFLDSKFYSPHYYFSLEHEIQKILSQTCKRGYFIIHINRYPQKPDSLFSFKWNKTQAKKWKEIYKQLSKELNCKNDFNLNDLINREGVLNIIEKPQSLSLREKNLVKQTFKKSLELCLKERRREGSSLKKDIVLQLKQLHTLTQKIALLNKKQQSQLIKKKSQLIKSHSSSKALKAKKSDNHKELSLGEKSDIQEEIIRMAKKADTQEEIIRLGEKSDIHEEIIRMREHLNHFKKILNKAQDIGRKLDFYSQEILREINTMGSKSQNAELTLNVISAKSCLEKIKEQIQNVE